MHSVNIGVLALQGDFAPHVQMLKRAGIDATLVRRPSELSGLHGLLLPGGESTTMTKLLTFSGLDSAIPTAVANGMAIWGTCAGCILLGRQGSDPRVKSFRLLDVVTERNAYGRQTESFTEPVTVTFDPNPIEGVFIRAPKIISIGTDIEIVGTHRGDPVHLEAGNVWASTFHPELTNDPRLHERFVTMVRSTHATR